MEKLKMNHYYPVILICLVILVIAGSYFVYHAYLPPEDLHQNQPQDPGSTLQPTPVIPTPVQPDSPSVPGSMQDTESVCNHQEVALRVPVPVDTSIPIQDPMPGIRYSLGVGDSGRTIVLGKGEIVEINLGYATGQPFYWIVPVSGCGLELLNDGRYSNGGDFWNNTGNYRARYRAVSVGTSILDGKLVLKPEEAGDLRFNLTVIVK
ncbi:MAG: hypothetical protein WC626_09050 [Methanoregula sp.]